MSDSRSSFPSTHRFDTTLLTLPLAGALSSNSLEPQRAPSLFALWKFRQPAVLSVRLWWHAFRCPLQQCLLYIQGYPRGLSHQMALPQVSTSWGSMGQEQAQREAVLARCCRRLISLSTYSSAGRLWHLSCSPHWALLQTSCLVSSAGLPLLPLQERDWLWPGRRNWPWCLRLSSAQEEHVAWGCMQIDECTLQKKPSSRPINVPCLEATQHLLKRSSLPSSRLLSLPLSCSLLCPKDSSLLRLP